MRLSEQTFFTGDVPEFSEHALRYPSIFTPVTETGKPLFSLTSTIVSPSDRLHAIRAYLDILEEAKKTKPEKLNDILWEFYQVSCAFWYRIAIEDTTKCAVAMRQLLGRMNDLTNNKDKQISGLRKSLISNFAYAASCDYCEKYPTSRNLPRFRAMLIIKFLYFKQATEESRLSIISALAPFPGILNQVLPKNVRCDPCGRYNRLN